MRLSPNVFGYCGGAPCLENLAIIKAFTDVSQKERGGGALIILSRDRLCGEGGMTSSRGGCGGALNQHAPGDVTKLPVGSIGHD